MDSTETPTFWDNFDSSSALLIACFTSAVIATAAAATAAPMTTPAFFRSSSAFFAKLAAVAPALFMSVSKDPVRASSEIDTRIYAALWIEFRTFQTVT